MATVFDKILDKTTGPKSYDWYRKQVRSMTTPGARSLINKGKATLRPKYGIMNLFGYDPKHKDRLPYYDTFFLYQSYDLGPVVVSNILSNTVAMLLFISFN